ncbi:MAG: hypothetical protein D6780_07950 [Candidatus Dadabacteria bacterium]|nr:MAG: hypothetical protein D6780_07950 [Candidatus Dadabacteria bacterium]
MRRCFSKKKKYYKNNPAALSDERIMQRSGDFCCNDKVSKVSEAVFYQLPRSLTTLLWFTQSF